MHGDICAWRPDAAFSRCDIMMHFLEMGGYAAFVWPAYGVTVLGLGGAVVFTLRSYFCAKRMFAKLGVRNTE